MDWTVEFDKKARKQFDKLDGAAKAKICEKLERILALDDPHDDGKALTGNYKGLWRYRTGDYRIVCDLVHKKAIVLVVKVSHRSSAYNRTVSL